MIESPGYLQLGMTAGTAHEYQNLSMVTNVFGFKSDYHK